MPAPPSSGSPPGPSPPGPSHDLSGWVGLDAVDASGAKLGRIEALFSDDLGRGAEWFAVRTGRVARATRVAPVKGAAVRDGRVWLGVTRAVVQAAPEVAGDGRLDPADERRLYEYYGLERTPWDAPVADPALADELADEAARGRHERRRS